MGSAALLTKRNNRLQNMEVYSLQLHLVAQKLTVVSKNIYTGWITDKVTPKSD